MSADALLALHGDVQDDAGDDDGGDGDAQQTDHHGPARAALPELGLALLEGPHGPQRQVHGQHAEGQVEAEGHHAGDGEVGVGNVRHLRLGLDLVLGLVLPSVGAVLLLLRRARLFGHVSGQLDDLVVVRGGPPAFPAARLVQQGTGLGGPGVASSTGLVQRGCGALR